ncbi:MAG TPA: 4a-hydroxytetrahydrobiopterin dehydratase [Bradyrhizobium sp.]|jgi:pterin-4a-carbinolamine dehydratase|nr:4a-hydroxytetrahydrobiopterin dehydratase [Bradyrhizobium sp.]
MTSPCNIFVSYRRLDSAIFSQWLAVQLRAAYGQDCVFIDTENIRDAAAWAQQIESSLRNASLIIVVIGKSWLSISDEVGRRRIDLPDDWVRREIETGLKIRKRILPLLIEGAELPAREALPDSIAPLLDIQARRMSIGTIAKDMSSLVKDSGVWIGKQPIAVEIPYPYPLLKIRPLDEQNLQRLEARLPTWRVVSRQSDKGEKIELMRTFEFESFHDLIHFMNTAARFIDRIDHHPEWTNIWRTLVVYLTTWDIGFKPSMLDVDLAAYLDDLYKNYVRKISQQDITDLLPANLAG